MIIRACAAIVRGDRVLMVLHRQGGRTYWTLPGGRVEAGETPQQAVVREVREETGLDARVSRVLFDEPCGTGSCRCFLMHIDGSQAPERGFDPEEIHVRTEDRVLQGLRWHELASMSNDRQISNVLAQLDRA